ncbi:MAG: 2,3-dihydroxybiphenyl 1,2-dioxygenase [Chloroflexi bacterium]|nr:2,3-dihydroxybiphenyl 1,2-dioxygenase [Chloroflexota bacterium]
MAQTLERPIARETGDKSPVQVRKLGHLVFRVRDVERSIQFYTEILNFRVSDRNEKGMVFFNTCGDHHTLGIAPAGSGEAAHRADHVRGPQGRWLQHRRRVPRSGRLSGRAVLQHGPDRTEQPRPPNRAVSPSLVIGRSSRQPAARHLVGGGGRGPRGRGSGRGLRLRCLARVPGPWSPSPGPARVPSAVGSSMLGSPH